MPAAIIRARTALVSAQVVPAEKALCEVLAFDTATSDRVEANLAMANLSWHVHADSATASRFLRTADSLDPTRPAAWLERSRMNHAFRADSSALVTAREALERSVGHAARLVAGVVLSAAIVEPLIGAAAEPAQRRERLAPEIIHLRSMVRGAPGDPRPARLLILAAVLADDGSALLDGWGAYYMVGVDVDGEPFAAVRAALVDAIAKSMANRGDLSDPDVILALARSRLFEAAAALATAAHDRRSTPATSDARVGDVVAYVGFLRRVRTITDEFYRQTALGHADEHVWRDSLAAAERGLWQRFASSAQLPPFSEDRFFAEIAHRYGALARFSTTGSFRDFHLGHVVIERAGDVVQYRHRTSFRFVALDEMTSNGFLSWFWDGRSATGGWSSPHTVVQIRPLYAVNPSSAWWSIADSSSRTLSDAMIASDSVRDIVRARSSPIAFFPSVAKRLARAGAIALDDSLRAAGLRDTALERVFISEYSRAAQQSLIAHEARHAIDRRAGTWFRYLAQRVFSSRTAATSFDAALEFNAKLSEIAFAPRPQLAFGAIMAANVGDGTGHGSANARLLSALAAWMRSHANEIAGYDPSVPVLPQLPLLAPDQLRAAARSIDPLAGH